MRAPVGLGELGRIQRGPRQDRVAPARPRRGGPGDEVEVLVLLPVHVRGQLGERAEPRLAFREGPLRALSRRDVGVRAARARRPSLRVAGGHLAAAADPAPGRAVDAADAEFRVELARGALERFRAGLPHPLEVVGVDERQQLGDGETCDSPGRSPSISFQLLLSHTESPAMSQSQMVRDDPSRALRTRSRSRASVGEGAVEGDAPAPKHRQDHAQQDRGDRAGSRGGKRRRRGSTGRPRAPRSRRNRGRESRPADGERGRARPRGRRARRPPRCGRRSARPRETRRGRTEPWKTWPTARTVARSPAASASSSRARSARRDARKRPASSRTSSAMSTFALVGFARVHGRVCARAGQPASADLSCGKRITSRIDGLSVKSIARRSMPMPSPAVGGSPYSRART